MQRTQEKKVDDGAQQKGRMGIDVSAIHTGGPHGPLTQEKLEKEIQDLKEKIDRMERSKNTTPDGREVLRKSGQMPLL